MTYYGRWTYKFEEGARKGAAGVLIVHEEGPAGYPFSVVQGNLREKFDLVTPDKNMGRSAIEGWVTLDAAKKILKMAGQDFDALKKQAASRDFKPVPLGLSASMAIGNTLRTIESRNVVAKLEGSDPALKDEYITIESHLDGAVGSRAVDGDTIYNSADDNASGSAANLAIAEHLMTAPRPKRSIVFIWDSGEERGLWGTRYFVHQPPVPLEQIVAHINIDMIGANRAPGSPDAAAAGTTGPNEVYLIGPGVLSAQADALLEAVNRSYLNLRFNREHDRAESEFFYPRTDAGPFLERGILTIGFTTGIHARYHAPADEARFLDPKKMEAIARTAFAAAWMLADMSERPRIDKAIPKTVPRYK
jgi:Zn-dependent M28 family amino/carboxypeptidase